MEIVLNYYVFLHYSLFMYTNIELSVKHNP